MPKKTNNQISQKSLDRSRGVSLPNGNRDVEQKENNIISGKLDEIVKTIEKSYSNLTSKLDVVLSGINSRPDGQLGDSSAMSVMSIVSGGKDVSSSTKFESIKSDIKNMSNLWKKSMTTFNKVKPDEYASAYSRLANGIVNVSIVGDITKKNNKESNKSQMVELGDATLNAIKSNTYDINVTLSIKDNKSKVMLSAFIDDLEKIANIKNPNQINDQLGKIKDIVPKYKDIVNSINEIGNQKINVFPIGDLFSSLNSLGSLDTKGIKQLKKNLRTIYWMTTKSNLLTNVGVTSKGLIFAVLENLKERSEEVKDVYKKIGALNAFMKMVYDLGDTSEVTTRRIWQTRLALNSLLTIYDTKGPLVDLIEEIKEISKKVENTENIKLVQKFLSITSSIGSDIDVKNILKSQSVILGVALEGLLSEMAVKSWKNVNIDSLKTTTREGGRISLIKDMVSSLATVNDKDLDEISKKFVKFAKAMTYASISGKLSKEGIVGVNKITEFVKNLKKIPEEFNKVDKDGNILAVSMNDPELVKAIDMSASMMTNLAKAALAASVTGVVSSMASIGMSSISELIDDIRDLIRKLENDKDPLCVKDDTIDKIESIKKMMKSLMELSLCGAAVAPVAPLGIVGFWALSQESKFIKKMLSRLDEIEVDKDLTNKVKQVGLITAIAGGLLIGAGVLGMAIIKMTPEIIGFAIMLSPFILTVIGSFNLATRNLKNAKENAESFSTLIVSAGMTLILGGIVGKFVNVGDLVMFISGVSLLILGTISAYRLALKNIGNDVNGFIKESVEPFSMLILASGATLAYGSLMTSFVSIEDIATFSASLALLMLGVTYSYANASKSIEKSLEVSDSFLKLIMISGAVLATGALVTSLVSPGSVIGFSFALALLVGSVTGIYALSSKYIKDAIQGAEEFGILIGISSLSMLVGGMMIMKNPWLMLGIFGFGLLLGLFVFLVRMAYSGSDFVMGMIGAKFGGKDLPGIKSSIDDAKEFAILVAISAATMLIGGGVVATFGWDFFFGAIGFALDLGIFLALVGGAYRIASMAIGGRKGIVMADEFMMIVATSAATLVIGGLLMMIPGMKSATIDFALTLSLFILGVCGAYGIAGKLLGNKGVALGYQLSVLIGVSAITLLVAGLVMMNNPGIEDYIWTFIKTDLVLIGGMALILGLLGKFGKDLTKGALALVGIIGTIWLTSLVFKGIVKIVDMLDGRFGQLWGVVGSMFGILTLFTGGIIALGVLIATGVGGIAFGLGVAALLTLNTAIGVTVLVMIGIVKLIDMMSKIKEPIDMNILLGNVKCVVEMVEAVAPLANPLLMATTIAACATISSLGMTISTISKAIQDYADLKVPVYDENGKQTGYRNISTDDFDNAAANIKTIITTIGGAIQDTYKENPSMFSNGFVGDLLGMDTPFTRVVKACTGMGKMISKIAEGVKEMAELRVPIYKGTDKVGYRQLTDTDFNSAAVNVSTIILTLGQAVIDTYNKAPEGMFDSGWLGNMIGQKTPFGRVVTGVTGLGKMISVIAKGVKDMAELRVPTYDANGKQIGSRELNTNDFILAAVHTQMIVSCLGNAILSLGSNKETSWMFEDHSKFIKDGKGSRFYGVVTALTGIGKLMSETAQGVKDVASLRIQKYDENGKILKGQYEKIDPKDLLPGGSVYQHVQGMLGVLPGAIMQLYEEHDDWFKDSGWFTNDGSTSPFAKVKSCLGGLGKILAEAITSIKNVQDLKYNQDMLSEISEKIKIIIRSVPQAIQDATMDKDKNLLDMFDDEDVYDSISKAYSKYTAILNNIVKSYFSINKLIKEFDKDVDIHVLNKTIDAILTQLPFSISRGMKKMSGIDEKIEKNLTTRFQTYSSTIGEAIDVYRKINNFRKKIVEDQVKDTKSDPITSLSKMQGDMLDGIVQALAKLNEHTLESMKGFAASAQVYKIGMTHLFDTYNSAPKDQKSYDLAINAIKNVNVEIGKVKNTQAFKTETEDVSKFTKTINSLDTSKATTFTNLVTALDSMARRLGGLDKLTNALANKLAVVLDKLVRELQISAKTINKADEMQRKRHAAIKESIRQISTLLNKPVEVKVTQEQQDMGADGGMTQDTGGSVANDSEMNTTPAGSTGK